MVMYGYVQLGKGYQGGIKESHIYNEQKFKNIHVTKDS